MYPSEDQHRTPRVIPLVAKEQTTTTDDSWSLPLSDLNVRPKRRQRIVRTISRFFVGLLIGVGLTLGWQSHGDEAREIIRTQAPWLSSLLPDSTTTTPTASGISSEVVQQLEPMARDLAVVRRNVEELAERQEKMTQYVATLRAVEQDIIQRMSLRPASGAVSTPPAKLPLPAAQAPPARAPLSSR